MLVDEAELDAIGDLAVTFNVNEGVDLEIAARIGRVVARYVADQVRGVGELADRVDHFLPERCLPDDLGVLLEVLANDDEVVAAVHRTLRQRDLVDLGRSVGLFAADRLAGHLQNLARVRQDTAENEAARGRVGLHGRVLGRVGLLIAFTLLQHFPLDIDVALLENADEVNSGSHLTVSFQNRLQYVNAIHSY